MFPDAGMVRMRISRIISRVFVIYTYTSTCSDISIYCITRNCVYETLCPEVLACPPSYSPGNLFTILLQLTKSEATSFNSFRDIFIGRFRCPNMQRALIQKKKNAKAIPK